MVAPSHWSSFSVYYLFRWGIVSLNGVKPFRRGNPRVSMRMDDAEFFHGRAEKSVLFYVLKFDTKNSIKWRRSIRLSRFFSILMSRSKALPWRMCIVSFRKTSSGYYVRKQEKHRHLELNCCLWKYKSFQWLGPCCLNMMYWRGRDLTHKCVLF